MGRWMFTVHIIGTGDDIDEAWNDAVDSFSVDPGEYEDDQVEEIEEDD